MAFCRVHYSFCFSFDSFFFHFFFFVVLFCLFFSFFNSFSIAIIILWHLHLQAISLYVPFVVLYFVSRLAQLKISTVIKFNKLLLGRKRGHTHIVAKNSNSHWRYSGVHAWATSDFRILKTISGGLTFFYLFKKYFCSC